MEFYILANQASKYEKEKILLKANSKVELLKILFRISLNCTIVESKEYLEMENMLQEIGKMTQGWIKYKLSNYKLLFLEETAGGANTQIVTLIAKVKGIHIELVMGRMPIREDETSAGLSS